MRIIKIILLVIIAAMVAEAGYAQQWMQYEQPYPVSASTIKTRHANGRASYTISPGQNYFDKKAGAWKKHTFEYAPLSNGKFMYQADYDFVTGKFYDDVFTMANNNMWLSWIPIGANHSQVQINGDTAFYNNVYSQVKAARVIGSKGIKEYLRAGSIAARDSFEYVYRTNAAQIKRDSLYFYLLDDNGDMQLAMPRATYWDANGIERTGKYRWKKIANGDYYVTMTVDYSGMTFPVIIDPTTIITDTSKIKDGQIRGANAAVKGTAYGATTTMTLLSQGTDIWRLVRYYDLSAVAERDVSSYIDSVYATTNSWTATSREPSNWRISYFPLTVAFTEATFNWNREKTGAADSLWTQQGVYSNTRAGDIDTTYWAKFNVSKPGSGNTWTPYGKDSAIVNFDLETTLEAWLSGALTNNGFLMALDSGGYDSSYYDATPYSQVAYNAKEAASNPPRLYLDMFFTAYPCTLSLVDTNAVSALIDTVLNGGSASNLVISIFNASLGRYYALDAASRVRMVDTIYTASIGTWSRKRIPLKSNTDNYLLTVSQIASVLYDTSIQMQRVGNPATVSILPLGDTLFFRLYDNQGNFKWFRVDSLIRESRLERYTYNSPIFAFAFVDRWREYAWRRMQEKIEQWN